jgi:hypothetical protein
VSGTLRWMSFASTSRKFDSKRFIERWGGDEAGLKTRGHSAQSPKDPRPRTSRRR